MAHHHRGVTAHEVVIAAFGHHLGQLVGMILGVQVRTADAAAQHAEDELPVRRARIGHVDDVQRAVHATDPFHSAIVAR